MLGFERGLSRGNLGDVESLDMGTEQEVSDRRWERDGGAWSLGCLCPEEVSEEGPQRLKSTQ